MGKRIHEHGTAQIKRMAFSRAVVSSNFDAAFKGLFAPEKEIVLTNKAAVLTNTYHKGKLTWIAHTNWRTAKSTTASPKATARLSIFTALLPCQPHNR